MKKVEFDIESKEIQESLIKVCVSARIAVHFAKEYKKSVEHIENDIAFASLLTAHGEAMTLIDTLLKGGNDVSFDELIREIKKSEE